MPNGVCQSCDLGKSLKPFRAGSLLRKMAIIPNGAVLEIKWDRWLERCRAREQGRSVPSLALEGTTSRTWARLPPEISSRLAICLRGGNELERQASLLSALPPSALAAVLAPSRRPPGGARASNPNSAGTGCGPHAAAGAGRGDAGRPGAALQAPARPGAGADSDPTASPRASVSHAQRASPHPSPRRAGTQCALAARRQGAGLGEERPVRAPIAGLLRLRARFEIPR